MTIRYRTKDKTVCPFSCKVSDILISFSVKMSDNNNELTNLYEQHQNIRKIRSRA